MREYSVLPVTVKQLLKALQKIQDEDSFTIDNTEIDKIYIVGSIISVDTVSTSLNYVIDDGTGHIDVRVWLPNDNPSNYLNMKSSEWVAGSYVRAIGNLRVIKSKRTLVAFRLIRIGDLNEITYHHLECIYAHLYNIQGGLMANSGNMSPVKSNIFSSTTSFNNESPKQQQMMSAVKLIVNSPLPKQSQIPNKAQATVKQTSTSTTKYPIQSASAKNDPQLSALQNSIMQVIRLKADPINGLSLADLQKELKQDMGVKEDKVKVEIAWLMDLGHIFSTIDDEHFQVTD